MAAILRGFGAVGVDPHAGVLGEPAGAGDTELAERVDQQLLDERTCSAAPSAVGDADRIG